MKVDIDNLMEAQDIDALLVTGPGFHNPPMYFFTGGGHLTQADLVKKRGEDPMLFYNPMERDEAAKTGLKTRNLGDYRLVELIKQENGNLVEAHVQRYQKMLADIGLTSGRVAVSGRIDAGEALAIFTRLEKVMPGLSFIGQMGDTVILQAMATKDSSEVERIRRMGKITTEVVALVADFLTSQRVENETLVLQDGRPLTVGDIKSRIRLWLAERGAEPAHGMIFAIGREAGVPHSSGTPTEVVRLGQTIVFDIFPCETGGGYFYDFTRTWCLGYATDEVWALYEDVLAVYRQILDELELGTHCPEYQRRACELFEARGHPTIQQDSKIQEGYVHSLGHGVGLNVHERPWFGRNATPDDRLNPGAVFTVEPGLYYPERGMGVRVENTVWARTDGKMDVLAEYPLDLVLPVK